MSKKQRPAIPRFETPLIETHCHLDYLDQDSLLTTLDRGREVGIERTITIAVSPDNLDVVMKLVREATDVWGTQGIHPHEAEQFNDEVGARIRHNAMDERILAIGEIGLDYYYDHADRRVQRQVFEQQLQLASDLDMPVVIHSRDADADMAAILANFATSLTRRGVIHSFTSGLELAERSLELGFMLGFNGIATFKKADNVREAVAITPLDRLLLETDSPYLTPVPYRGQPNAPYFLPFVAQRVAEVKEMPVEHLLERAYRNSAELFFKETQWSI
ncbi:MAG: TatD family hydrolase [Pseudomonadota bacterium]